MGFLVPDNGRVGFDDDGVLVAVVDDGALLAPGVKLRRRGLLASGIPRILNNTISTLKWSIIFEA